MARVPPDEHDVCVWRMNGSDGPFVNEVDSTNDSYKLSVTKFTSTTGFAAGISQPVMQCLGPNFENDATDFIDTRYANGVISVDGASYFWPDIPITVSLWYRPYGTNTNNGRQLITKNFAPPVSDYSLSPSIALFAMPSGDYYATSPHLLFGLMLRYEQYPWPTSYGPVNEYRTGEIGNLGYFTLEAPNNMSLNMYEWNHCGATFDGTTMKLYMNGDLICSKDPIPTQADPPDKFHIDHFAGLHYWEKHWLTSSQGPNEPYEWEIKEKNLYFKNGYYHDHYNNTTTDAPWSWGNKNLRIPGYTWGDTNGGICDVRIANTVRPLEYFRNIYRNTLNAEPQKGVYTAPTMIYYKMRASTPDAPGGFVTWVNVTGDDQGRPLYHDQWGYTHYGQSVIIDSWRVEVNT